MSEVQRPQLALRHGDVAGAPAHWAVKNPEIEINTTNLLLVTRPGRTADIEQQLNLGVRGPRHVHMVKIR